MTGSTQVLGHCYAPRAPAVHKAVQPERSTVLQSGVPRIGVRHPELTMKALATLVAFSISAAAAFAENCRALPAGPEHHACAEREHPQQFEAKLQHCKDLATARGDTIGAGSKRPGGMRDFVQACMQGRQH